MIIRDLSLKFPVHKSLYIKWQLGKFKQGHFHNAYVEANLPSISAWKKAAMENGCSKQHGVTTGKVVTIPAFKEMHDYPML